MDDLDDRLRSAADDLRSGTSDVAAPNFAPRRSGGGVLAAVAIVILALAAFAGLESLTDVDGINIDQASDGESPAPAPSPDGTEQPDRGPLLGVHPVALDSLLTNGDPVPSTDIVAPNLLGDVAWLEPDFRTKILRLTEMGDGEVTAPMRSSTQAFNADGSAFLLYRENAEGGSHVLFDGRTLQEIGPVAVGARDIGDFTWHPSDPDLLYFPDPLKNELIETNVRSNISRSAVTFDQCDQVDQGLTSGSTGGATGYLGLLCRVEDQNFHMVHDLATGTTVLANVPTAARVAPVSASPDGSIFVVVEEDRVAVLNGDLSPASISPIPEDVNRYALSVNSETGEPVLVFSSYDTDQGPGLAIVFNLITGTRTDILSEDEGDGFPPSEIGLASSAEAGLVAAISRTPDPNNTGAWFGEVVLIDPTSGITYRLGHHRMSIAEAVGGWGSASVAISPDATLVLFSSDWGSGKAIDTYAIPLTRGR